MKSANGESHPQEACNNGKENRQEYYLPHIFIILRLFISFFMFGKTGNVLLHEHEVNGGNEAEECNEVIPME